MRLRTGIDLIAVQRIRDVIKRQGSLFLDRLFTPTEQQYCDALKEDPATRYAGHFALKEAVVKALGAGIGPVNWLDIEVRHHENGEPYVILSDSVNQRYGTPQFSVSLSHCREYATAIAIYMETQK